MTRTVPAYLEALLAVAAVTWVTATQLPLLGLASSALLFLLPVLLITAQRDDADLEWPPAIDHPITVRMPLDPPERHEAVRLAERFGSAPSARFVNGVLDALARRMGRLS